jgi:hypothetical protein
MSLLEDFKKVVRDAEASPDKLYELSHDHAVKICKEAEAAAKKVEDKVGSWIGNGVKIIGAFAVLMIAYKEIGGDIASPVSSVLKTILGWFGQSSSLTGSEPFCIVVFLALMATLGAIWATALGHKAISTVDGFICKYVGFYRDIRKLIKLPGQKATPGNVDYNGDAIWVAGGSGAQLYMNKGPVVAGDNTRVSIMQLAIPVPTSFSVTGVPATWIAPSGMTNAQALAYRLAGAGLLPAGAQPWPQSIIDAYCGRTATTPQTPQQ